ncbi:hypothetical protein [Corynebacterium sp. MC3]|uniref:hypothetical protein n=1 Tax=Corynebacterium sp. MC3 TaxID=1720193 RepID=UPI00210155A3|nr:hypothetical protein [Corynebacterium sp. MC3]
MQQHDRVGAGGAQVAAGAEARRVLLAQARARVGPDEQPVRARGVRDALGGQGVDAGESGVDKEGEGEQHHEEGGEQTAAATFSTPPPPLRALPWGSLWPLRDLHREEVDKRQRCGRCVTCIGTCSRSGRCCGGLCCAGRCCAGYWRGRYSRGS